ncbi:ABC transporter ATP-binding protein [Herbaspirillum seropedicae]|uniref:ABC transporter ATP-binding protein n=1 Tax=Herbaspirillum seropedicae TaxID=964 RepID=UPI0008481CD0|nr:ABC transporter ATP-binding protein [Herbaspirillum seropedicae]AON55570.1 spermidine/putrescine ABC transporter ATPase [Herbaspirillum seropedicae]
MFLEVEHLSIRYPRTPAPAVDAVSLRLAPGELGALIGPSGSGKTSLLRAVAGLEPAQAGLIRLDGQLLEGGGLRVPAEQRRIGMVFQDFALFPHLNVADNIAFGLRGRDKRERSAIVAGMLALVGLPEAGAKFPHQLSGGQQQRIALARALAPQPRLLLLDEPFSSLDVELRERLAHDVRDILKRTHTTALMVTHDQMEAFAVADVVGVMRQGQLEQWDTPYALYHRPATRFAADFIGHGVLLQGQLRGPDANAQALASRPATGHHQGDEQEEIEVETAAGLLRGVPLHALHALHGQQAAQTSEVDVLLRADDVIHDDASPFRARVVRKSFRGAEFLYTLALENGQTLLSLAPSHHDHAVGEWIGIRLEVTHLVTFARTESASAGLAVAAVAPAAPVALAPMAADAADLAHEASRR